jgi:hypothetical protein
MARCTDTASTPGPTVKGECGGVSWQGRGSSRPRQHEPACGRGGCGRGKDVRACERAQRVGACVMAGRGSRACVTEGRGQLVWVRGGGCVRACECVEAGRRLTGVCGCSGGGVLGFLCFGVGAGTKGTSATAICTDEASRPGPAVTGECGVGGVAGAWQQQAAAEHEPACGRGGCGRGMGVRACERAQRGGARVMEGRGSRACATEGRGQLVLARGGGV